MSLFTVLLMPLALLSPAQSQTCRIINDSKTAVTVVASIEPAPAVRQTALELLQSEIPPDQFAQSLRNFLVNNAPYVFAMRNQFNTLAETIGGTVVDHVAIDLTPEKILQAEKDAWTLMAHAKGFNRNLSNDDLTTLTIIAFGPAMAMRVGHPNLFIGTRLEGFPNITTNPPRAKSRANADAKYQEVLDEMGSSSSSRKEFRRMVKRLKRDSRPYDDLSIDETKERLVQKFWRPAQKHVKQWLDVFYAEKSPPKAAGLANYLTGLSGSWLIYLPAEKFRQVEARGCAQ